MTKTELLLFEKIIENAVTKAVNEVLNKSLRKDLREIKFLQAKIIKEGLATVKPTSENVKIKQLGKAPISLQNSLREADEYKTISRTTEDINPMAQIQNAIPESMANHYANSESLPDIDAPIFINQNSLIMQEIREKYKA
jgi:hypothetical protein